MITQFKIFEEARKPSKYKLLAIAFKNLFKELGTIKIYNFFSPIYIENFGFIVINKINNDIISEFEIRFADIEPNYTDFPDIFLQFLNKEDIKYHLAKIHDKYSKHDEYFIQINIKDIEKVIELVNNIKDDGLYINSKKYNL